MRDVTDKTKVNLYSCNTIGEAVLKAPLEVTPAFLVLEEVVRCPVAAKI
jgi:hypothetical protein